MRPSPTGRSRVARHAAGSVREVDSALALLCSRLRSGVAHRDRVLLRADMDRLLDRRLELTTRTVVTTSG